MIVGSILHGAYGDYYEQAICLKHMCQSDPKLRLRLFFADVHRMSAFEAFDFSFAESVDLWTGIPQWTDIDHFHQFQIFDAELKSDVLNSLPSGSLRKFDLRHNLLPWNYLRKHLSDPDLGLKLSPKGAHDLVSVEKENGLDDSIWARPTVGFLWRYRHTQGAVKPWLQASAQALVAKYSHALRRVIQEFDCHVLVFGMNVKRTEENKFRIDAKFPEFGLDLPPERSTHMKGLSWPLELDIATRCTVFAGHPSGFTEAVYFQGRRDVLLVDPVPHYLLKLARRRMPLFGTHRLAELKAVLKFRSEDSLVRRIGSHILRSRSL